MKNYLERLNRNWNAWDRGFTEFPASSTDNAVVRFDGTTGKLVQNSVVTIGDTGAVAGVTSLAMTGALTGATAITTSSYMIAGGSTIDATLSKLQVGSNDGTTTHTDRLTIGSTFNSTAASIGGGINIASSSHTDPTTATEQGIYFQHRKNDGTGLGAYSAVASFKTASADKADLRFYYGSSAGNTTEGMRMFTNGNVAIGTTTDNTAKLQVSGNFSATQIFAIGDAGAGLASTVSFTNVTTESLSSGACTIVSGGTTARVNTGWVKIYSGTAARYFPYWTTITG